MKKFSALIAIVLCLIIGGVYATWTYPGTTINNATSQFTPTLTIEQNSGAPGVITAQSTLAVDIKNLGSYQAGPEFTGGITITYTPNPGASADLATGIPMKIVIDVVKVPGTFANASNTAADQTETIFATVEDEHATPATATITQLTIYSPNLTETVDTFVPDGAKTLGTYVQEGNSYKWTITNTQFEQLITFCNGKTVFLNTRAIAEDFATRAGRSLIDLTISKN